jgi:hypothetical protein
LISPLGRVGAHAAVITFSEDAEIAFDFEVTIM